MRVAFSFLLGIFTLVATLVMAAPGPSSTWDCGGVKYTYAEAMAAVRNANRHFAPNAYPYVFKNTEGLRFQSSGMYGSLYEFPIKKAGTKPPGPDRVVFTGRSGDPTKSPFLFKTTRVKTQLHGLMTRTGAKKGEFVLCTYYP